MGWTSIYQLCWCSPGVQGFDTLPYHHTTYIACIYMLQNSAHVLFLDILMNSIGLVTKRICAGVYLVVLSRKPSKSLAIDLWGHEHERLLMASSLKQFAPGLSPRLGTAERRKKQPCKVSNRSASTAQFNTPMTWIIKCSDCTQRAPRTTFDHIWQM